MTDKRRRGAIVAGACAAAALAGAGVGAAVGGGGGAAAAQGDASREPIASTARALSINELYRRARAGVVEITVSTEAAGRSPFPYGDRERGSAQGSGFVYDRRGHVVTNHHVVAVAGSISVELANGKTYGAELVGSDPSTDLAVLRIDAPASVLHPLALGNSSDLRVGDGVAAIGSPFGLEGTLTTGIVSALHRQITSTNGFAIDDTIQTDAAINHGNSGGPLLDMSGKVVGVNAQIESGSGGNDGVGFAIPSNTVQKVVAELLEDGRVEHAYLGVAVDTAGGQQARGAEVTEVRPDTPAELAGLRAGDVITAVAGEDVRTAGDLRSAIGDREPGEAITLTFVRDGETRSTRTTLATRPT